MRFEQNRFEKLKHYIELEEEQAQQYFKPTLSKGSKKILEKKQTDQQTANAVHERLYSAKQEKAQSQFKQVLNNAEQDQTFKPTINKKSQAIKREAKIEEVLLTDAKRRSETLKQKQAEQAKRDATTDTVKQLSKNS
jgi:hypothetical protein